MAKKIVRSSCRGCHGGYGLGWDRSNIDLLTDNSYESCDPAMGATSLRVLLCNVEKATEHPADRTVVGVGGERP